MFTNSLDRFPNICFILSHAGGTLPFVAWRAADIAWRQLADPEHGRKYPLPLIETEDDNISLDSVLSRLKRFWYDTALSPGAQIDAFSALTMLDAQQKKGVERDNALQLFPRFAR